MNRSDVPDTAPISLHVGILDHPPTGAQLVGLIFEVTPLHREHALKETRDGQEIHTHRIGITPLRMLSLLHNLEEAAQDCWGEDWLTAVVEEQLLKAGAGFTSDPQADADA